MCVCMYVHIFQLCLGLSVCHSTSFSALYINNQWITSPWIIKEGGARCYAKSPTVQDAFWPRSQTPPQSLQKGKKSAVAGQIKPNCLDLNPVAMNTNNEYNKLFSSAPQSSFKLFQIAPQYILCSCWYKYWHVPIIWLSCGCSKISSICGTNYYSWICSFSAGDDLSSAATYDFECPANHFSVKIEIATNQANVLVL